MLRVHSEYFVDPRSSPTTESERDSATLANFFISDQREILCSIQQFNHRASFSQAVQRSIIRSIAAYQLACCLENSRKFLCVSILSVIYPFRQKPQLSACCARERYSEINRKANLDSRPRLNHSGMTFFRENDGNDKTWVPAFAGTTAKRREGRLYQARTQNNAGWNQKNSA